MSAATAWFNPQSNFITSPLAIPGCSLWLDAADSASVLTSGSNVTQWNDKSGNGYNASSNSNYATTSLPTYSSNTANKYVQMAPTQALCTATYNYTTAWSCFVCMNTVFLGGRWLISPFSSVGIVMMGMNQRNNKILGAFTTNPIDITGNQIQYTSAENTSALSNLLYYRDGTIQASNVTNRGVAANASAKMGIGANATLSDAMVGTYQVYEIIIYNRYLNIQQREQVEGYLAWKWGLQNNLSRTHPYANSFNNPGYFGNLGTSIIQPVQFSNTLPVRTGLALWLDAADSTTVQFSSGANISNWIDKSGNGRNFRLLGNTSPVLVSNIQNSNSVISFNGTSQTLNNSNFVFPSSAYTIFSLQLLASTVGNSSGYQRIITSDINLFIGVNSTSVAVFTGSNGSWNDIAVLSPNFNNSNQWALISTYSVPSGSSSALSNFINGTQYNTKNGTTGNFTGLVIGGLPNGQFWNGYFAEFLVYNRVLSTVERQQTESYLGWKWGLQTNLPTTHPYYNNATFANLPPITNTNILLTAGFQPSSLSGLALWLDAADSATIRVSSGSNISQWNDKSGCNYNMFQPTSSNQPYLIQNATNNLNGVRFIATNSTYMNISNTFNVNGLSNISIFIVATPNPGATTGYHTSIIWWGETGGWGQVGVSIGTTGLFWRYGTGQANIYPGTTRSIPANSFALCSVTKQSLVETPTINGTQGTIFNATNSVLSNNANVTNIGRSGNNTYATNIVCEILFYSANLSTAQRQQVEGYLAWKWGLTGSLPASHPNKYMPP